MVYFSSHISNHSHDHADPLLFLPIERIGERPIERWRDRRCSHLASTETGFPGVPFCTEGAGLQEQTDLPLGRALVLSRVIHSLIIHKYANYPSSKARKWRNWRETERCDLAMHVPKAVTRLERARAPSSRSPHIYVQIIWKFIGIRLRINA